ncbi:MAG: lipid-A-disaccharide synthase [bacterium]
MFKQIKIMLCAGEISGDLQASHLVKALFEKNSSINIFGLGGEKCKNAGMNVLLDLTSFNTVGILESLQYLSKYQKALKKVNEILDREKPNLLILVDNQGFNLNIAKLAKKKNIPILYYFAPQIWIWGEWNGIKIAKLITQFAAVYKKEFEIYKKVGANVSFIGHPLLDTTNLKLDKENFLKKFDLDPNIPIIGLFPGSRFQEIKNLLPVIIESAIKIKNKIKSQFVLSVSSSVFEKEIIEKIKNNNANFIKIISGYSYDVMNNSSLIITSSGTTTLEASYFKTPQIVIYKISALTYYIAKLLVKYPFVSLPNILAEKEIVPELLQKKVNSKNITELSLKILNDINYTSNMKINLEKVINNLGSNGALERLVKIIFEMIK